MRVYIKITDGINSYIDDLTEELRRDFKKYEIDKTFEHWTRPITCTTDDIDRYENHFILDWMANFAHSHRLSAWMYDAKPLTIEITHCPDIIQKNDPPINRKIAGQEDEYVEKKIPQ